VFAKTIAPRPPVGGWGVLFYAILLDMDRNNFIKAFGWYGVGAILSAYALNSFGYMGSGSVIYQLLNVTGAIGIVFVSLHRRAYQPAVLNAVWAIIALLALTALV
jgi:hypothetical protein